MAVSWPSSFTWLDYLLFGLTLLVSALVGIYHALKGASSSTSNYLMGGKTMPIFPVAMSLAASSISATTLLGAPTEVYLNGTMYIWITVSAVFSIAAASYVYLPIFHRLQLVSANQYLEKRFNHIIRRLASGLFVIRQLFYLSIVVAAPSLALTQVTGMSPVVTVTIMFAVCTFYTAIGGIKAVVWTDTIQIILMYGSIITVLTKGVIDVGGCQNVWERNYNTSRFELFNVDVDPTVPHTVWSLTIGGFFYWMSWYAVDQTTAQRFLSISDLRSAQMSMWSNLVAVCGIIFLCGSFGLVIFARYFDCDPISSKAITKADQIVPFFVMDVLRDFPGLPGLFVAGVVSAALSTLSSVLNAVALVVLEDFIRPFFPAMKDQNATRVVKGVSLLFSCLSFSMFFLVAQVKTILDATISFDGAVAGSIFGVFTLGIFFKSANTVGAGVGMLSSFGIMMCLGLSTQIAKSTGAIHNSQSKPVSTENCPPSNVTYVPSSTDSATPQEIFVLLRISYLWYTAIGMTIVIILGLLVSFLTKKRNIDADVTAEEVNGIGYRKRKNSTVDEVGC